MLVLLVQRDLMLTCEASSSFRNGLCDGNETESIRELQRVGSEVVRTALTCSDQDGINGIRQAGLLSEGENPGWIFCPKLSM
jgi:hypothetical protein